jgi:DNA-binding SARP family transcriptional activator
MAAIRLELFGGFQAASPSGAPIALSSRKGRALLAYLALQGRAQSREKLSGLLWGGRGQAQAYSSLRHELVELRRAFRAASTSPIVIDGDAVALAADTLEIDVAAFERHLGHETAERLQRAARLYRGPLLDGLVVRESNFEAWLTLERGRLHDLAIGVFDRLAACSTGASAVAAAKRLVSLDPLREASHRTLMQIFAEQGDTELAVRQYKACREVLQNELGVNPATETDQLYQKIIEGKLHRPDRLTAPMRSQPTKPVLAVLPFEVFMHEPELEAIAAGLIEDIITSMARFRLVSVVSRHSTVAYK